MFNEEILNPKLLKNTFSLSACNPKFSGNIKILVDNSTVYMESIEANEEMSSSILKGYRVDTNKPLRSNIKRFCDLVEDKSSFYKLPDQDFEVVEKYVSQPSNIYRWGAYSDTDRRVDSTHRFFAPMFLSEVDGVPDGFAIFKVQRNAQGAINVITNETASLVKYYDLSNQTNIGKFLRAHKLEISEQEVGISINYEDTVSVIGMDINSGVITEKDVYANPDLKLERTVTEAEAYISRAFEVANMIDPRFLNLEFTFDLDTTDIANNDTFFEVIGMYVWNESITDAQLDPTNALNIAYTTDYIQVDAPVVLASPLYKSVGLINAAAVGTSKPPVAVLQFNGIPNVNQKFSFAYDGNTEVELLMTPELQGGSIAETIDLIADALTDEFANTAETFVLKFFRNGTNRLHVVSTIASVLLETITLPSVPPSVNVLPPFIGAFTGAEPNLIGTDETSITLINKNITDAIDAIELSDGTVAIPSIGWDYLGNYAYKTNQVLEGKDVLNIKLLVERPVEYYRIRNVEHRKFDFNRDLSYHTSPLDFDLAAYRTYLISRVNQPDYLGRLPIGSTPTEIADYKAEVLQIIDNYFNTIDFPSENMLVKSIDKSTFEFTVTDNEYEPLQEFNELGLLQVSPNSWVSKFMIRDGFDVSNAPQKYNYSMIHREDSFMPSLRLPIRSVGKFTHSWYLIGSGTPPWYNTGVIDGYTVNPVDDSSILDTVTDVYGSDIQEWSMIKTDPKSKVTSTFFRGVRLLFPVEYDGYKFSAVLVSNSAPENADSEFRFLDNKEFKTLTLVINQFIPEPILTGLEETGVYYLDRSVLYFSNGGNTTEVSLSSLGEEDISIILFENSTAKTYNGIGVGTEWIYDDNGTNVAHIQLNTAVNNFDFTTMLVLGGDFEIFYGDVSPSATTTFGIKIEFRNIVEIGTDYFWCTEIYVTLKENGVAVNFDIVVDYVADNTILINDNKYATAESIAKYNALFDRTISNNLSSSRYNLLSAANIADTLNAQNTKLVDSDTNELTINVNLAVVPQLPLLQSLVYDFTDYSLSRESSIHKFMVTRPSFYYDPITSVIIESQNDRIDISHQDILWFRKCSVSLRLDDIDNSSRASDNIPIFGKDVGDYNLDAYYSYHINRKDFQYIPWIYTPSEIRGFLSRPISVAESLVVEASFVDAKFDLLDVLDAYANKIMNNQDIINYNFLPDDYVTALRVYDVNTDIITNEQIIDVIVRSLIRSTLVNVLRVEKVVINGVDYDTSNVSNTVIRILALDEELDGDCTVHLIHQ